MKQYLVISKYFFNEDTTDRMMSVHRFTTLKAAKLHLEGLAVPSYICEIEPTYENVSENKVRKV